MTGLIVLAVALAATLAFGLYRRATDGRPRAAPPRLQTPRLEESRLGHELGSTATFVQFSSATCAPCRGTRTLLSALAVEQPDLAHVELDAETRLDLVEEFDITRTPTVLLLDHTGAVRQRIVGAPRRPQVLEALQELTRAHAA